MALIIDSPWIPGYVGVKHLDFFLDPEVWFQSHLRIHREFPDITFVPGWWMEYGMAAEPSALGALLRETFSADTAAAITGGTAAACSGVSG